jgi:hypothetical protein
MIDLFASSWVDPRQFSPAPAGNRDIDLAMLANFGVYKRHHVLFRALEDLPRDWKIVLAEQPNGTRTREVLPAEADSFGLRGRFEMREQLSDNEVCELLCRAKMSLISSKREGSCVAVMESMFANTPVALLEGAQVGSAKFIGPETGVFALEDRLAEDLKRLHQNAHDFSPRAGCLKNGLAAQSSSARLNAFLAEDSSRRGIPWTRDILAMHWRPNPLLLNPEKAPWLEDETKRVRALTGIQIGPVIPT